MTIFYYDVYAGDGQIQVPSDATAIVAKATEGTYYRDAEYSWFKQQAANRNLPFSGYHFLNGNDNIAAQAQYYFNFAGTTPCMVDVEPESQANSYPTVDQTVAFIEALHGLGGRVWSVYFPAWYLNQVGGDLSRVTALGAVIVSSNYTNYSDNGPGWQPYGGATPTIWQFTSTPLDKNAFKGTPAELAALIDGDSMDLSASVSFPPALVADFSDYGFIGPTTYGDLLIWTAARVSHLVNQVADLENKINTGGTVTGAPTAQQNAAETLAELKARL